MKVLLTNLKSGWFSSEDKSDWPTNLNLGLLGLATAIKKLGVEIVLEDRLCDLKREHYDDPQIKLFFLSVDILSVKEAISVSRAIKAQNPKAIVVWGSFSRGFFGKFVDLFKGYALDCEEVDFECYSFIAALDLIQSFRKSGSGEHLLEGIAFRRDGKKEIRPQLKRDLQIFDIDYGLVDINKYIWRSGIEISGERRVRKVIPIITGEGCPNRCTFCVNSIKGIPLAFPKPEHTIATIDRIVDMYDPDLIWFQDDNFFAHKKRTLQLFEHIDRKGYRFKWAAQGRLEYFDSYLTDDFFLNIVKNCEWFSIGFESASARLRDRIGKSGLTNEKLLRVVELTKQANPKTWLAIAFIVGLPDETRQEMIDTAKLILDIKRVHPRFSITYQIYRPYPETQEYINIGNRYGLDFMPKNLQEYLEKDIYSGLYPYPWIDKDQRDVIDFSSLLINLANRQPKCTGFKKVLMEIVLKYGRWRLKGDLRLFPERFIL